MQLSNLTTLTDGLPAVSPVDFRNEVHIWCASLSELESNLVKLSRMLSKDERSRAGEFVFDQHRRHFIAGRGLLRLILGHYQDIDPQQVQFCYGPQGKPGLKENDDSLQFNLSHSHGLVLIAVGRLFDIGVDLEYVRSVAGMDEIIERHFAPTEKAVLCSLSADTRREAFFECWTRKEAYLKACGRGLDQPLDQVEVSLDLPARLLNVTGNSKTASSWSLCSFRPATGYVAALAVGAKSWRLKYGWPNADQLMAVIS